MSAMYRKELKSYFYNMTGVVFIALVLIITGIFATILNFQSTGNPEFEQTLDGASFIFFLAIPILTMRSFAEEKSLKTDQLLYSLPIGMTRVVVGKFLAMVTVLAAATGLLCVYPVILSFYGHVNFLGSYCGIFAFFLLGCALIAIGMFISTLTESQIISAVISFGVFIAVYFMQLISTIIPGSDTASLICFLVLALVIGIISTLILGFGMSLFMTELGGFIGNDALAMLIGIIMGLIGIVGVALAYPIYNLVTKRERERVAPEILKLSDELMK